jgi:hypothetical protein
MVSTAGNDSRVCNRAFADVTDGGGSGDDSDDHSDQTGPPLGDPKKLCCLALNWAGDAWARGAALDVLAVFTTNKNDVHVEVETFLFMTDFPDTPLPLDGNSQACNTHTPQTRSGVGHRRQFVQAYDWTGFGDMLNHMFQKPRAHVRLVFFC